MKQMDRKLLSVYNELMEQLGYRKWWPTSGKFRPLQLEVCIGAILTQNTNWRNAEKALQNLIDAGATTPENIAGMPLAKLQKLIKPSGFYRQKAKRLREFCRFVAGFEGDFYKDVTREQLLGLNGIGRETADSILLYACGRPVFVIDAYTRRLFSRLKLIDGTEDYEELRDLFERSLPRDAALYKEFHALIVEHEKVLGKAKARQA